MALTCMVLNFISFVIGDCLKETVQLRFCHKLGGATCVLEWFRVCRTELIIIGLT